MRVKLVLSFVAVLLLLATFAFSSLALAQQTSTSSAISNAQNKLVACFNAAKAAETDGANITTLTSTLNAAGLLLSKAEAAYASGDGDSAQNLAAQSQNVLNNFISQANSLQSAAAQARNTDFLINVVGSIGGTVAIIVGSAVIWVYLKRKYEADGAKDIETATS